MYWVFAMINNRLAELFFDKIKGKLILYTHAYVKKSEYKTRHEQRMIREDTKKYHFTYRNKKYFDQTKRVWITPKGPSFMSSK